MREPANAARSVAGVVLAGGRSKRMGGDDKSLVPLFGKTMIERVIERVRPQVSVLAVNANGDPDRYAAFGLPIVADSIVGRRGESGAMAGDAANGGFAGPLAGVLAGMDWAAATSAELKWLASFAVDVPFVPVDLVERLLAAVEADSAVLACARSGQRIHPVFALWPLALREDLRIAIAERGVRKVEAFMRDYRLVEVAFEIGDFDPFFNINDPADFAAAMKYLAGATR
ncbi:MAG: molybdenum cofactor guanylyltransferase MobA [Alphaproteobacteria bacterium]